MRRILQNKDSDTQRFRKILVSACDLIMLSSCSVVFYYTTYNRWDFFALMLCVNAAAIIGLRQWLCFSLDIPWLYSPFNKCLKRGADILLSTMFLLTAFPPILVLQAICIKKSNGGAILSICKVESGSGGMFQALRFNDNFFGEKLHLGLTPFAFNILIGNISIWDLNSIKHIAGTTDCTTTDTNENIGHTVKQETENEHI